MKAITIKQPFAELIVSGIKDIENRTWTTEYRGELAIHASKQAAAPQEWLNVRANMIESGMSAKDIDTILKRAKQADRQGAMVGSVDLFAIHDLPINNPWAMRGYKHWILKNAFLFPNAPGPVVGRLGLWEWTPSWV